MALLDDEHPGWDVIERSVDVLCGPYRGLLCAPFRSASEQLLESLFASHPLVCVAYGNAFDIPELTASPGDELNTRYASWHDERESIRALSLALPSMLSGKPRPVQPSTEDGVAEVAELVLAAPVDRIAQWAAPPPTATKEAVHRFGFGVLAGCVAVMVGIARGRPVDITKKITPELSLNFAPARDWPYCRFEPTLRLFDLALSSLAEQERAIIERYYIQFDDSDDGVAGGGGDHLASLIALDGALRKLAWS